MQTTAEATRSGHSSAQTTRFSQPSSVLAGWPVKERPRSALPILTIPAVAIGPCPATSPIATSALPSVLSRASYQSPHTLLPDCAGTYRMDTSYRPSLNRRSGLGMTSQEATSAPPAASGIRGAPAVPDAPGSSGPVNFPENTTKRSSNHRLDTTEPLSRRKYKLRNNHGAHEFNLSNGCFRTTQSIALIDYSLMMRLVRAGFGTTLVPAS